MKKKTMLIFALSALSTMAIAGTGAGCGDSGEVNPPEPQPSDLPNYKWEHNDAMHWQVNEKDANDKRAYGGHVDLLNNETGASGKDGKCDSCGRTGQEVVNFVTNGGTAVDPVTLDYGSKLDKPEDPSLDGHFFDGWYKDEELKVEFDFDNETITETTILYAKWRENDNEGQSVKYAAVLEKGKTKSLSFGDADKLFFTYTAEADGRYMLRTGLGNSARCKFTTDLDEDGVYYGNGCAERTKYFDLDAGDKVVVTLVCEEELPDDATVGVVINDPDGLETLPIDSWFTGEYISGSLIFKINREEGTFLWGSGDLPLTLHSYIGGATDTAVFKGKFAGQDVEFTMHPNDDGKLVITCDNKSVVPADTAPFEYAPPQDPIPLEKFSGTYEGKHPNGITKVCIYPNGNGYIIQSGIKYNFIYGLQGSGFDQTHNLLNFGNYNITLNLEDGNPVSINISYTNNTAVFNRVGDSGDEIPTKLPLLDNTQYVGETYLIRCQYGNQYWGTASRAVSVIGYVAAQNKYTIEADSRVGSTTVTNTYVLVITGEDDAKVIAMYDEAGENLLDTLSAYKTDNVMPTTEQTVTLERSQFKNGFFHYTFTATTAGWYKFTCSDETLSSYSGINASSPFDTEYATEIELAENGNAVYLTPGTLIGLKISAYKDASGNYLPAIQLKIAPSQAPSGYEEDNPYVTDEEGEVAFKNVLKDEGRYVHFDLPAGKYFVNLYKYNEGTGNSYNLYFYVNDKAWGWDSTTFKWVDGVNLSQNHNVPVTVTGNEGITIKFVSKNIVASEFRMKVFGDYSEFTDIEFDTAGSCSLSASGIYGYSGNLNEISTYSGNVKFTSETEFTLSCEGVTYKKTELELTPAQLKKGFKLVLAEGKTVEYTLQYAAGAQQNPNKITNMGTHNILVDLVTHKECYATVTLPANDYNYGYLVSVNFEGCYLVKGDSTEKLKSVKVNAGETVTLKLVTDKEIFQYTVPVVVTYDFSDNIVKPNLMNVPIDGGVVNIYTATVGDSNNFLFDNTYGSDLLVSAKSQFGIVLANGTVIQSSLLNGSYTATVPAGVNVSFVLTSETEQSVAFALVHELGSEGYPAHVTFEGLTFVSAEYKVDTDTYFDVPVGTYEYSVATGSTGYIYVNDLYITAGKVFDVKAGDLVHFVVPISGRQTSAKYTLTRLVAQSAYGEWEYTDNNDKVYVTVDKNTVTVGETVYTLSDVEGNVYTFKNDETTVSLTVGETLKLGNNTLAEKTVENPDDGIKIGATYCGTTSAGSTITVTVNSNGTVTHTVDTGETVTFNAAYTEQDGTYTFAYKDGDFDTNCSFTLNEDGTLTFTDDYLCAVPVTLTASPFKLGVAYRGSDNNDIATLTFNANGTVHYKLQMNGVDLTLKYTGSGNNYTITHIMGTASLVINDDGTLTLNDSAFWISNMKLTPTE